jgi:hypothetical protein
MATAATTPTSTSPGGSRGKSQIHWSEEVWKSLDHAVIEEMMRTRVAAKFLPHVFVEKKQTNVASDVVNVPNPAAVRAAGVAFDPALSVDESAQNRIQEYWGTFKLSVAQVDAEEREGTASMHQSAPTHPPEGTGGEHHHHPPRHHHMASTAVSLAMRAGNILAQAEDLILFNGQNAVVNSPLFNPPGQSSIQFLDPNLSTNLDLGLLNIDPTGNITLPASQVIAVHPAPPPAGIVLPAGGPPRYAENSLNAVAQAFSALQAAGHYEHYALALHTIPYADLHQALPGTLIEPVEPVSHLIKAGIHGSGTLPPFTAAGAGLPTTITTVVGVVAQKTPINTLPQFGGAAGAAAGASPKVLFTGVLVSLSGNTMDHVRGKMEEQLDVIVTFNQKDANEQYRFRVVERFALRLKDPSAVILLLFMDV